MGVMDLGFPELVMQSIGQILKKYKYTSIENKEQTAIQGGDMEVINIYHRC